MIRTREKAMLSLYFLILDATARIDTHEYKSTIVDHFFSYYAPATLFL